MVADLVFLLHLFIILFVILGTFSTDQEIVFLALMFQISILTHWIVNNNECILTQVERYIRNEQDSDKTFFGRVFNGVYSTGKDQSVILFVLIMISLYRLKNFRGIIEKYGLRRVRG